MTFFFIFVEDKMVCIYSSEDCVNRKVKKKQIKRNTSKKRNVGGKEKRTKKPRTSKQSKLEFTKEKSVITSNSKEPLLNWLDTNQIQNKLARKKLRLSLKCKRKSNLNTKSNDEGAATKKVVEKKEAGQERDPTNEHSENKEEGNERKEIPKETTNENNKNAVKEADKTKEIPKETIKETTNEHNKNAEEADKRKGFPSARRKLSFT